MEFMVTTGKKILSTFGSITDILFNYDIEYLLDTYAGETLADIVDFFLPTIGHYTLFDFLLGGGLIFLLCFSIVRFFISIIP